MSLRTFDNPEHFYIQGGPGWIWDIHAQRDWEDFWSGAPSMSPSLANSRDRVKKCHLWRSREKYDPGAFGQEKQKTGDCVSHGSRSARDTSRTVEFHIKGEAEQYYKRSATEPTYGSRGHSGQGMTAAGAARFEEEYGWLFREKYQTCDLTNYNADLGAGWGRSMPQAVKDEVKANGYNVGTVTRPRSVEEVMDLLANGYAAHSGQQWGTGTSTGSDGLNTSNGSGWAHDMAIVGYDSSKECWDETVFFVPNSWGPWNKRNPRWKEEVMGPWIPGMIVIPIGEFDRYFVKRGSIHHYSSIAGFPVQDLPDYGFGYV